MKTLFYFVPRPAIACVFTFFYAASTRAADVSTQTAAPEQPANPALIERFEKMMQPMEAVQFRLSYIGETLADVSGGYQRGAVYEGLLKAGVQLDLEKLIGWNGATLFANVLYPHGDSLTEKYTHDLEVVSNIDAYDSARLDEAWLEQKLFGDQFSVRLGELAADTEFFVCDSGALFINGCFGALPLLSLNFDAPVYPMNAAAVRVEWVPTKSFTWRTGVYSGDVGEQTSNNTHGGRVTFSSESGALILSEMVYKTNAEERAAGLPGTFKVGGFFHTGKFDDMSNDGVTHRDDSGAYFIADQALYREQPAGNSTEKNGQDVSKENVGADGKDAGASNDQGLNCFTRIGGAWPDDRNLVHCYIEGGLTYKGLIPGRTKDVCGLACSYAHISPDVRRDDSGAIASHHETVLEATYQAAIADYFSVQPDFQYVINPGGTGDTENAVVIGARVTLSF